MYDDGGVQDQIEVKEIAVRSNICRVEFNCAHCDHQIKKGERYVTVVLLVDKEFKTYKSHTADGYCV